LVTVVVTGVGRTIPVCLAAILAHTRQPYELVFVADGEPVPWADRLGVDRPGPVRVEVVRAEGLGYAAGCNRGAEAARGQFIVFLDPHTVVTPAWLSRLTAVAVHEWPRIGLVGPVSGGARPPQWVTGFGGQGGLDAFAANQSRAWGGRAVVVNRLGGFCLLVRRGVLERVRGFDERLGAGHFAPADICLRARLAGYWSTVAQGVYVHLAAGPDAAAARDPLAYQEELARFAAKWGPEYVSP